MVTSYYIMKLTANKTMTDVDGSHGAPCTPFNIRKGKISVKSCRVCLQDGTSPIYGNENTFDLIEALEVFGDIQIRENDDYPKYLCRSCHKFIDSAILFRKTAKKSDEMLRRSFTEDSSIDQSHEYSDNAFDTADILDDSNWSNDDDEALSNIIKEPKAKPAARVKCRICDKVLTKKYYKHHLSVHDPNHRKYVCEVCGKSFRMRCNYVNHKACHRNDFPYKCQLCPYRGRTADLLRTHKRSHSGDYRYMCTECPARFVFKTNLHTHMKKHKEPQYKCNSCKRAFHSKLLLQRHIDADHLGIKNHVCNICGKAFGYRKAMMSHQRGVHKREKLLFGRLPSYLEAERRAQNDGL